MSTRFFDLDTKLYDVEKIVVTKDGSLYTVAIDTRGDGRIAAAKIDSGNKSVDYEISWEYALLLHRIFDLTDSDYAMPRIDYINMEKVNV